MEWIKIDKDNLPKHKVLGACFDRNNNDYYKRKALGVLYQYMDGTITLDGADDYCCFIENPTHYIDINKFDL